MMLQQTQVGRVVPKYKAFLKIFPTARALSNGSQTELLKLWSGLGYNRRALFLKRTAEAVVKDFKGIFPKNPEILETLPGIGPYTARAVATFSYNDPYIFIETNIRAVYLFEFFPVKRGQAQVKISDAELFPLLEATLPKSRAKEWYYALMDYGAYLKKTHPNPSRRSAHHATQSPFKGSIREIRGGILRMLASTPLIDEKSLVLGKSSKEKERIAGVVQALEKEGFIVKKVAKISVKNS